MFTTAVKKLKNLFHKFELQAADISMQVCQNICKIAKRSCYNIFQHRTLSRLKLIVIKDDISLFSTVVVNVKADKKYGHDVGINY